MGKSRKNMSTGLVWGTPVIVLCEGRQRQELYSQAINHLDAQLSTNLPIHKTGVLCCNFYQRSCADQITTTGNNLSSHHQHSHNCGLGLQSKLVFLFFSAFYSTSCLKLEGNRWKTWQLTTALHPHTSSRLKLLLSGLWPATICKNIWVKQSWKICKSRVWFGSEDLFSWSPWKMPIFAFTLETTNKLININ